MTGRFLVTKLNFHQATSQHASHFMRKYLECEVSENTLTDDATTTAGGNGLSDGAAAERAATEQVRARPQRLTRQPVRLGV